MARTGGSIDSIQGRVWLTQGVPAAIEMVAIRSTVTTINRDLRLSTRFPIELRK
jgi:hypothetical protein